MSRQTPSLITTSASPRRPRSVVVFLPAMGVAAGYYAKLVESLVARGTAVVVVEMRGQGESPVCPSRDVDFGFQTLLEDLDVVLRSVRERHPDVPLVLAGHSLGGHVALIRVALEPGSVDAVALIATATPHHAAYKGWARLKVFAGMRLIRFLTARLGYYPGHRVGFGGLQPRTLMREWTDMGRHGRYVLLGGAHDLEGALATLSLPVLALTIDGDETAPPSACRAIVDKLPAAEVEEVAVGAPHLGARALHHLRWARQPDPVAEHLVAFVERRLHGSAARLRSVHPHHRGSDANTH